MKKKEISCLFLLLLGVTCLLSSCKTSSMIVTREQQQGDRFSNEFEYKQAIIHYNNSIEASRQAGIYRNPDVEAGICRKLAYVYSATSNYEEALKYIYDAINLDSASNNKLALISDYRSAGRVFLFKGDFFNGISMLEKTLSLVSGLENSIKSINQQSVADTYLSLAEAKSVLGHFTESENYVMKAYSIYKSISDTRGLMEAWLILGNISKNLGDIKTSVIRLNISYELAVKNDYNTARHHQALGEAYSAIGEYEKALKEKLTALREAEKTNIEGRIIWATIGVGDAYYSIGDLRKADNYYKMAVDMESTGGSGSLMLEASADLRMGDVNKAHEYYTGIKSGVASGISSIRMGQLMMEEGKADSALFNFSLAAEYFAKSGVREGEAIASVEKCRILLARQEYTEALILLNSCLSGSTREETLWQAYYLKARTMEFMGKREEAIKLYKESVDIIESIRGKFTIDEFKSIYIEKKVKVYDELINLLMENDKVVEACDYSERARARVFLDMIGNRHIAVKPGRDSMQIAKEQELRMKILSLNSQVQSYDIRGSNDLSESQLKEELRSSRMEYNDLLNLLKLESPEYSSMINFEPVSYKSAQSLLDTETLVLNYWVGEKNLLIWLIGSDFFQSFVMDATALQVDEAVKNSRLLINRTSDFQGGIDRNKISGEQNSTPAYLQFRLDYDLLFKPFEDILKKYRNICIIPHGSLHLLPFQACIDTDGQFMVNDYNIFYSQSLSVFSQCQEKNKHAEKEIMALALGDLSIGGFSGLPGTKTEVEKIIAGFDSPTVRYEKESTESFLKENASQYNKIHLSTHGMLDPDLPMYSFVLFSPTEKDDGFLTASEVFGLDLNASLVTLSACETGLGKISKGDEMIGLSRAFIYAGASSVVVSLWSVADQQTAILMTRFYEFQKNHSLNEALSMAQREVMKEYYAPFYWAAFQMIGKGN